jgi:hypothetical protein
MNPLEDDTQRFLALVEKLHEGHERLDQVEHCKNVKNWLQRALEQETVSGPTRKNMLLAALGHDLYEDVKPTPASVVAGYGSDAEVDRLIWFLTERPEDDVAAYVEQVAGGPEEARLIKLCDGIDNYDGLVAKSKVQTDPAGWAQKVRKRMEPMFTRLESIPFRKYPKAGAWLSTELAARRQAFWQQIANLLPRPISKLPD